MMKKSTGYLKYLAVLALTAALVALTVWIRGMHDSSMHHYHQTAEECLTKAAEEELNMRLYSPELYFETWFTPYTDTSTYVNKKIITEDTVIHFQINRHDPTVLTKVRQFYLALIDEPLNTTDVDSIFKKYMAENSLPVQAGYVEYIDLKTGTTMESNAPAGKLSGYIASNVDTLDIFKTIGVRAHAKVPLLLLMRPVLSELVIAVALILIVVGCIIKLIVDIRRLHSEGFRLLHFVSQKAENSLAEAAGQVGGASKRLYGKGFKAESEELEKVQEGIVVNKGWFERLRSIMDNEEGKIVFNKTVFSVKELLEELKIQYEKTIRKEVKAHIIVDDNLLMHTDRYYLKRVFEEILDNSVKYSPDMVLIQMVAAQQDHEIVMVVCDCGGGITQQDFENIYIINYDIAKLYDEEIKKETKTGLGLSFVFSFVRSLGGFVHVISDDGMSGVRIEFPQTKDDQLRIADYMAKGKEQKQGKTINLSDRNTSAG